MSVFKQVWQFRQGSQVWSEVMYCEATDLKKAMAVNPRLLNARMALAHPLTLLEKIRVSDVASPRAAQPVKINQAGLDKDGSLVDPNANLPAPVSTACVIKMSSTAVPSSRRLWLRGVNQFSINRNPTTGADFNRPLFAGNLIAYYKILQDNSYVIRTLSRLGQDGVTQNKIVSFEVGDDASQTKVTFANNVVQLAGNRYIFSRLDPKHLPGAAGHWSPISTQNNTMLIAYKMPTSNKVSTPNAMMRQEIYRPGAVIDAEATSFLGWAERKTRGGSTGSRGSRRAVRLHLL